MADVKVRTHVVTSPMDRMAPGTYHPMCCTYGQSGLVVTVEVDEQGTQTWTYDYSNLSF